MDFLDQLNEQQRQAVTAGPGPVQVLAGPGSGKTRVLTQRVAYLIRNMGARPYQILAVTFTNKAARSMGSQMTKWIGIDAPRQGLWLGTFHSTCARLLRNEAKHLPINSNFVIYDDNDQLRLVTKIIKDLGLDLDDEENDMENEEEIEENGDFHPSSIHTIISNAKNNLIRECDYSSQTQRDKIIKNIYEQYQKFLQASNAVDFDDLLLYAAYLLTENRQVREKYAQQFQHILVDEFQDTNLAQYTLLKHLASVHHNIFVVGDPDQSIYRWRGADYRNVQRFEEDYPNTKVFLLEQNYRSKQAILDAAMAVIDRNGQRRRKKLFTERGQGERPIYHEAFNEYAEASYVVNTIHQLISSKRVEGRECAVMYRTNAQSRILEEAFLQAGLSYRLVGAQRFYGRREVKDAISYMRLVYNPADQISLDRIINIPNRKIGNKTYQNLLDVALEVNVSASNILLDLSKSNQSLFWSKFSNSSASKLSQFGNMFANWVSLRDSCSVTDLFTRILDDIQYQAFITKKRSNEDFERWENVEELRRLTNEFEGRSLAEFLENVALISDQDTLPENQNSTTLLTLHAAKGLEYEVVFIVGLNDGILPHSRSILESEKIDNDIFRKMAKDVNEELDEECRLLYVGITRAKNLLYLTRYIWKKVWVKKDGYWFNEDIRKDKSRFLDSIAPDILNGRSNGGYDQRSSASKVDMTWKLPPPPKPGIIIEHKYPVGTRVKHNIWGEGTVLESRIEKDDEILAINFKDFGLKRLGASLAKLTILEKK